MSPRNAACPEHLLTDSDAARAAWSCYCASFAGIVEPDGGPAAWLKGNAAALALGAHDRHTCSAPLTRAAMLAEVARLTGEAPEDPSRTGLACSECHAPISDRDGSGRARMHIDCDAPTMGTGLSISPDAVSGAGLADAHRRGAMAALDALAAWLSDPHRPLVSGKSVYEWIESQRKAVAS